MGFTRDVATLWRRFWSFVDRIDLSENPSSFPLGPGPDLIELLANRGEDHYLSCRTNVDPESTPRCKSELGGDLAVSPTYFDFLGWS
jgi:hypothetical protein